MCVDSDEGHQLSNTVYHKSQPFMKHPETPLLLLQLLIIALLYSKCSQAIIHNNALIKQHILDKGLHKAFRVNGGEEKKAKGGSDCQKDKELMCHEVIVVVFRKFNYSQDNECRNTSVRGGSSLGIHRADTRRNSVHNNRQNVSSPANDQRALWLCASTTKGCTVPMMSGERELRGQAREKKRGEIEGKEGKQRTRVMQK
ncbi:hypothetical protein JOB18_041471 [Solea senegalensis]|uniref:Uncharacterized protein n=1 Tax=Solea senegalensis TaxID=28829 RepID=A0AAV6QAA4_SOLSE|nr:hypothetical protein JOB18_041471 [Solea senegalensis]